MIRSVLFGAVGLMLPFITHAQTENKQDLQVDDDQKAAHRIPLYHKEGSSFEKYSDIIDHTVNTVPSKTATQ